MKALLLALSLLLAGPAFGAVDVSGQAQTQRETDLKAQVAMNSAALAQITASQSFQLQLVTLIFTFLSATLGTAITFLMWKGNRERHTIADEQRQNMGSLGASIDGVKTQLMAVGKKSGFDEAISLVLSDSPEAAAKLIERRDQLTEDVRTSTKSATAVGVAAEQSILTKPGEDHPPETIITKAGPP